MINEYTIAIYIFGCTAMFLMAFTRAIVKGANTQPVFRTSISAMIVGSLLSGIFWPVLLLAGIFHRIMPEDAT